MDCTVKFSSDEELVALISILRELRLNGPFADTEPEEISPGKWSLLVTPHSPDLVMGFVSVAELLGRFSRYVEITSVVRSR